MKSIMRVESISKQFGGVRALNNVSMDFFKGETVAICGENGAGKSTLLKILSGAYSSDSYKGKLYINEKPVSFSDPLDSEKAGIAMIYQEVSLVDNLTVADNLLLGNYPTKYGQIDKKQVMSTCSELLKELELELDLNCLAGTLNTGIKQMVSIAKAISTNPKILLLDEPTSSLTESEVGVLFRIIKKLKKKDITCVYISHKMSEVFEIADRIYVIRDGCVVGESPVSNITEKEVLKMMVGRNIDNLYPKEKITPGEVLLEVKHLGITSKLHQALKVDDVSFKVRAGEIVGFAGLVGSGRSETMNALFGALEKTKETDIYIEGKRVSIKTPLDAIKHNMALLTEDRRTTGLITRMDIKSNIVLPALQKIFSKFFVKASDENEYANQMKTALKIKTPSIKKGISTLSGGNQQKVNFAKWILTKPKIIILDEPTRGVDVGAKTEIYGIINSLAKQGVAIVLVSSEIPELLGISDKIEVFREGRIVAELARDEATPLKIIAYASGSEQ